MKFEIPHWFKVVSAPTEEEYLKVIESHNTHLSLFEYQGMWSMSIADAILSKYNVLFLSHSGYKEMLYSDSYSHRPSIQSFTQQINKLIQEPYCFIRENEKNYNDYLLNYSIESAKKIINEIT